MGLRTAPTTTDRAGLADRVRLLEAARRLDVDVELFDVGLVAPWALRLAAHRDDLAGDDDLAGAGRRLLPVDDGLLLAALKIEVGLLLVLHAGHEVLPRRRRDLPAQRDRLTVVRTAHRRDRV